MNEGAIIIFGRVTDRNAKLHLRIHSKRNPSPKIIVSEWAILSQCLLVITILPPLSLLLPLLLLLRLIDDGAVVVQAHLAGLLDVSEHVAIDQLYVLPLAIRLQNMVFFTVVLGVGIQRVVAAVAVRDVDPVAV